MKYWCPKCKTMENTISEAFNHECKNKGLLWEEINYVIKWTLENIKYLDHKDTYDIEKETDNCHGLIMNNRLQQEITK